jgi:hypothetical protein
MDSLFTFAFFTTPAGLVAIGLVAALTLILWDWRGAVAGLILVQWGVGNLLVQRFNMPGPWALAFLFLAGLAGAMLSLSAIQVRWNLHAPRAGNLVMRLLIVLLTYFLFTTQNLRLPLPLIDAETVDLLSWLALISVGMLLVSDSPLHTGISLALWLIPVHAATAILLPNPALIMVVGSVEMVLILACSYLMLPTAGAALVSPPLPQDRPQVMPQIPAAPAGGPRG